MKKIILALLLCNLYARPPLFSQDKDSLAQIQEMQRLNRIGDSLHKVQLAKDSIFQEQMDEALQKARRGIEKDKQKEIEEGTKEVVQRQEKEQRVRRKTMLLTLSAFLITIAVAGVIFKRRKQKNKLSP